MKEAWDFNQAEFDRFLSWLHPDREVARKRCEEICHRLIEYFKSLDCTKAEDQTKATIHRLIQRLPEIVVSYNGDPAQYCCDVAREVYREEFERLLAWLDPDREEAGKAYEKIRCKLIKYFESHRCMEADNLADKAINRVTWKVRKIADTYVGNPALYFYGVARKVYQEEIKPDPPIPPMPPPDPAHIKELRDQCLEKCLKGLPPDDANLVTGYFKDDKRAKIEHRREVAERLGINPNALRIRIHRILGILRACVKGCLAQALSE